MFDFDTYEHRIDIQTLKIGANYSTNCLVDRTTDNQLEIEVENIRFFWHSSIDHYSLLGNVVASHHEETIDMIVSQNQAVEIGRYIVLTSMMQFLVEY